MDLGLETEAKAEPDSSFGGTRLAIFVEFLLVVTDTCLGVSIND